MRVAMSEGYAALLIAIPVKGTTEPVVRMNAAMSVVSAIWFAYSVTSFNTSVRSCSDGVTNTSMYLMLRVSIFCLYVSFLSLYKALISSFETVMVESATEEKGIAANNTSVC